ncbi:hypothetical protein AtNW77_Chr1g0011481 [Arabidopsis thaliana]|uniref:F20B24.21 n=3 Tax=Arabidopsis TaxID=3701 RepID=Q9S701_ARATH|nr:hydroxyproline-rich glycoprotein family protein [Arabidopsis thaliana]KAG7645863.1 hypothetical protein ISN45_At01g010580 [Arabidopsis thaliana x Arabidopsis arenosa]AAD31334.1 T16B5.7 [Arabidopsis thaliana]AAF17662.1 F20B24.21 [Arabidopsis thaliana]AEE28646.1 hydroxyproline-rich glycoprotein family protein [Arabidopsis thaliana]OAP17371.1 hypothetical protein AXX17_AT1G10950 [Arabidopsis thaliana]|eukprot:NP_172549.1 hydroxyproline-rich glycoprotein family protein [Arabidopsis thaliana]
MKKHSKENALALQQETLDLENPESSPRSSGRSCSSAFSRLVGLRCLIVLVLSCAILLSAIFWLFPRRSVSEFKADGTVKLNASVQASFRLQKPVSEVVRHKGKIEHDILRSIGLSNNSKVTVLSLNQSGASNYTDVEFAVLPVPPDHEISKHSLSLLRSSFVKLFAKRSKLKLTTSGFGKPTSFQVLKFPGGITVDPLEPAPVSGVALVLFSVTIKTSISTVQDRLDLLNGLFEHMLSLEPYESVHFQLTNKQGSTISPPLTFQVYVAFTMRKYLHQRLNHFTQIIQTSRAKNLGLDEAVFGEVKDITFSTYLDGKVPDSDLELAPAPTPCLSSLC